MKRRFIYFPYVPPPPYLNMFIDVGSVHSVLIKNGTVWGWGYNIYGQLGDNSVTSRLTPVSILGVNKTFCSIAGFNHSLGLDKDGRVWGWGYNNSGQLGDNNTPYKQTPVMITTI